MIISSSEVLKKGNIKEPKKKNRKNFFKKKLDCNENKKCIKNVK